MRLRTQAPQERRVASQCPTPFLCTTNSHTCIHTAILGIINNLSSWKPAQFTNIKALSHCFNHNNHFGIASFFLVMKLGSVFRPAQGQIAGRWCLTFGAVSDPLQNPRLELREWLKPQSAYHGKPEVLSSNPSSAKKRILPSENCVTTQHCTHTFRVCSPHSKQALAWLHCPHPQLLVRAQTFVWAWRGPDGWRPKDENTEEVTLQQD
jgi:hypothetical protein